MSDSTLEQLAAKGDPLTPTQAALYDVMARVDRIDGDPNGLPHRLVLPMLESLRTTDLFIVQSIAAYCLIELRRRHADSRR